MLLNIPHLCELWEGARGQTDVALAALWALASSAPAVQPSLERVRADQRNRGR